MPAKEVPDQLGREVPGQPFVRRAHVLASGLEVEDDDAVRGMLHEGAKSCLRCRDARLGLAPLGDVVHVDDDAFDHRVVELVPRRDLAPAQRTVAMVHAHVGAQGSSGLFEQSTVGVLAESCEILGLDDHIRVASPDQVVDRVARQILDRLCREDDHAGPIDDDDRVGCVGEEPPEAVLAARERGRRDLPVARAHPDDAHDEHQSGGHQHRDAVAPAGTHDAGSPTEPDGGLRAREAPKAPHRRREHGRRTFERDRLRGAEDETHGEHRTPAGCVDHRRRADDLEADAQAERQAARPLGVCDRRRERERQHGDTDEHGDRHGREDPDGPEPEQRRERDDGHRQRLA